MTAAARGGPRAIAARLAGDAAALVALALLAGVAGAPLLAGGWFQTHEGAAPLERVIAFAHEIGSGTAYPRWLALGDAGKGSAFPHFYAPGLYLAAAHLFAGGVPLFLSLALLLLAALLAGAVGTYAWARRRFGVSGGFVAGTLYLFAPYHFVDLYVRGALAEFAALALLPWLFLGIDLAAERRGDAGPALIALATAGIVVTHNLSAFMIAPFAAAYLAWTAWSAGGGWWAVGRGVLGAGGGVGLSAFYWLPALLDQRHLRGLRAATTSGMYSFEKHFVQPAQLAWTRWGHGASLPGDGDGMSFQIGLVLLAFAAAGAARAFLRRDGSGFAGAAALLGLAAIVLTLDLSSPVYRVIPAMPMVQFPWRYLGPAVLFLSAAGAAAVSWSDRLAVRARGAARAAIAAGCAAACLLSSSEQRTAVPAPDMAALESPATISAIAEHHLLGALCGENEYLPAGVSDRARALRYFGAPRPHSAAAIRVEDVTVSGASMTFATSAPAPAALGIPWYYFPGWSARVDGAVAAIGPGPDGFLALSVPAGAHRVEVAFEAPPSARLATLISTLTAVLGVLSLALRGRRRAAAVAAALT